MLQANENVICRLCLKMCDSDFEVIEDTTLEMMNYLLLNLDLGVIDEAVICDICLNSLQRCCDFKSDCLHKNHHERFLAKDEDVQVNTAHMLPSEKTNTDTCNNSNKCYFCEKLINNDFGTLKNVRPTDIRPTLHKYFPQIVLNITEDFAVCRQCHESLQDHFNFLNKYWDIEEKIRQYCETEGTNSKGEILLKDLLHFASKSTVQNNIGHSELISVKREEEYSEEQELKCAKTEVKNENLLEIGEVELEKEDDIKINLEQSNCGSSQDNSHFPQQHNTKPSVIRNEQAGKRPYQCHMCPKRYVRIGHLLKHERNHIDPLEEMVHKCLECTFQTKHKIDLDVHMIKHSSSDMCIKTDGVYKCIICWHRAYSKIALQTHLLIHTKRSLVTVYKCQICKVQTKCIDHIRSHMLSTHRGPSEKAMYECATCKYQTKNRRCYSKHMFITHISTLNVTMYRCVQCGIQTRSKISIQRHMQMHNTRRVMHNTVRVMHNTVGVYECKRCGYRTEHKEEMQKHVPIHKSLPLVTLRECTIPKN